MEMPTPDVFNDENVSTVGKIFLSAIASAILGRPPHVKVRGTPEQIKVIKDALEASKAFHDEIEREGATAEDIMSKLKAKNIAAAEFKASLGVPWPL